MKNIFLVFAIFFYGCASTPTKKEMTPRQEYYLGRSVTANILSKFPAYHGTFNNYLNKIGLLIVKHSDRPHTYKGYHFSLIKGHTPLAVSAPGGFILLSTSIIKKIKNEDELAAVLAHEVGHISLKHSQESIDQSKKSSMAAMGVTAGMSVLSFFAKNKNLKKAVDHYNVAVADYSEQVINGTYSKAQEKEADKKALIILIKTGYNPYALIDFIKRLKSDSGGFSSSHPPDKERVNNIKTMLAKLKKRSIFKERTRRFLEYQERIR